VSGIGILDDDDVVPVVAKVVDVIETSRLTTDGIAEHNSPLVELLETARTSVATDP
jgi:hypothetical protein